LLVLSSSSKFQFLFQVFRIPVDAEHFFGNVDSLRTILDADFADSLTVGG
jgi:hypothetical protein